MATVLKRSFIQKCRLLLIRTETSNRQIHTSIYFQHVAYDAKSKSHLSEDFKVEHKFGVVFDIDGVLVRGSKIIPCAQTAIRKLNKLNIPLIYLTNGGCETEDQKAISLSKQLDIEV